MKNKNKKDRTRMMPLALVVVLTVLLVGGVFQNSNHLALLRSSSSMRSILDPDADGCEQQQQQVAAAANAAASEPQNFKEVALKTNTDKVAGYRKLPECLQKGGKSCTRPDCEREKCRPWGHFYDTIYDRWLGKYSTVDAPPIQFLEIGYFNGAGFEAYTNFLPNAELHSIEIACIEAGPRSEGKWPWGNFASKHQDYETLLANDRLHCGDASNYKYLKKTWTTSMQRPDAPPLMAVVEDASHLADHMATSLFFWFPRIQPGGILIVEDIQPEPEINKFRTHILPQVMKDLHWCGRDSTLPDTRCFPTLQPLLEGIHCEMHICVFVRNQVPSPPEPDREHSMTPDTAFSNAQDCLFGPHTIK